MGQSVTEIILERFFKNIEEEHKLPWQKGFVYACMNWYSEREYTGVNRWLLQGGSGEWITVNQLKKYNEAKKTDFWFEAGTPYRVVVWFDKKTKEISEETYQRMSEYEKRYTFTKDGKRFHRSWIRKFYRVYDIDSIKDSKGEKLPHKLGVTVFPIISNAQDIVDAYTEREGIQIIEGPTETASYTEMMDSVQIPARNTFNTVEWYYSVLFHELVHSTGTEQRLNRDSLREYFKTRAIRGKEELIAEFGSMLLMSDCNIMTPVVQDNSDAYVQSWFRWMKDNKTEVISAMTAAEQAMRYIKESSENILDEEDSDSAPIQDIKK